MNLFTLFISMALINNVVLAKFLAVCPFLGVSKKPKNALWMSVAVTFVIMVSTAITYCLYHFVLVKLSIQYLELITFILVIASLVQLVEMLLKKFVPKMYQSLGVFLPLITTNCAVLGTVLDNISSKYTIIESLVSSLGVCVGFGLVIYLFSTIRERLELADVPDGFKGIPISLITAAIMACAFAGFSGLV